MAPSILNVNQQGEIAFIRPTLTPSQLADWALRIDALYRTVDTARQQGGHVALSEVVPPGQRFVPTASSVTIGAVLGEADLRALFCEIAASPARTWIRKELGDAIACDLDQAWIRRQYAAKRYPQWHAPHGWHQDGGLGFDYRLFPDGIFPSDALLPMVTCWIALGSCGAEAPGLELVARRLEELLAPAELADARVRARFAPADFWRPVMEAGDALLFRGDILHRTFVTPAMARDRTSVELRFFPADRLPARLRGDRFVVLE